MSATFGAFSLPTPDVEKVDMYPITKTDLAVTDATLLATITDAGNGDIAVISTIVDSVDYGKTSYIYDEESGMGWVALNGNVEADKVIMTSDITLAGNYTQVGNLTKTSTGTSTFATKGMSVASALTEILSQRLQPTITSPYIGIMTLTVTGTTGTGATQEVGSIISQIVVSNASFSAGSYTYGPSTGVTASNWSLTRTTTGSVETTVLTPTGSTTGLTDACNIQVGDQSGSVTGISYTATCDYSDGVVAYDNLGSNSDPVVQISGGSLSKTASTSVSCHRKYFYGSSTTANATMTSAIVRALTASSAAASTGTTFSVSVVEGAREVVIAYPATLRDLTSVLDTGAFGTDIVGSFSCETVSVEGANAYTAISYKVWTYRPSAALGANTYTVTI